MKDKLWFLLIAGIIVRILISLSTFHPDMRTFQFGGQIIAEGNILSIYDYLTYLPTEDPITKMVVFNYPPAIYLWHGLFNFIISKIFGLTLINQFLIETVSDFGNWQFNVHLLLVKVPYFLFDILLGICLLHFFKSEKEKLIAFALWIFNPVNLYATYMMGQFDILPTFFTILSLVLASRHKLNLAAVALGMGAAFKIYPLFLLIPLSLQGKNWLEKIKLLALGVAPYILLILPYLGSSGFRTTALVANQTFKSLYAEIPISGGERLLIFPLLLLLFYLVFYYILSPIEALWQRYLIVLLLFFTFTHSHPQWFLWVTPFLILDLIFSKSKNLPLVLLLLFSFIGLLFFFDPSLTITLFAPAFPKLYGLPSIWEQLNLTVDYNFARSLLQTIFAAPALYLIYSYFPKKST